MSVQLPEPTSSSPPCSASTPKLPGRAEFESVDREEGSEGGAIRCAAMAVLESHVELGKEHDRRRERMGQLVAELRERTALVASGGGDCEDSHMLAQRLHGSLPSFVG
jgi:hypothetical protein